MACDQELCPNWAGDGGCPCAVLGVPRDDDELEAKPYEMWWWDCPACGDTNDARDVEPSGPEVCEGCGETVMVKR